MHNALAICHFGQIATCGLVDERIQNYFSSSNAKPPIGASVVLVEATAFFDSVEAKVNDSVTTATPAMRRIILDFIFVLFKV